MNVCGECDFELRAHAVGAGDQDRIAPAFPVQMKQRAEAANRREHAAAKRFSGHRRNAPLGLIRDRNVDAGVGVTHEGGSFLKEGRPILASYSVWKSRFQRTLPGWIKTLAYVSNRSSAYPGPQTSSGASIDM